MKEEIQEVNNFPSHIAIIMDGNGRWAEARGLPRLFGHRAGINSVRQVVEGCRELTIKALTLYAFSSENWKRPKREVMALMALLKQYLTKELNNLTQNDIRLMAVGHLEELPRTVLAQLSKVMDATASNKSMILNLALNYGSRREIVDAAKKVAHQALQGKVRIEDIDEGFFSHFLSTYELPDLDLLIRTSGEYRLSNFFLWQTSYAEIYITPTFWPDFGKEELYKAILEYQHRDRRFGGIKSAQ